MSDLKKNLIRILLAIFVFFYTSVPVLIILRAIGLKISAENYKMIVIYDFISSFIVSILIGIIYYDILSKDAKKIKEKNNGRLLIYLKNIIIYFLGLLAVKYISAIIISVISTLLGIDVGTSDNQAIIEKMVNNLPLLITLSASFFAPVSEEVLFRGGIRKLMNNLGVFITVSGLIFGLMHVTDNIVFILEILLIGIIVNYIKNNKPNDRIIKLSVLAIVLVLVLSGVFYYLEFGNLLIKIKSLDISEIINSISYIAMGMYLAYIYTKENNIFINIGVHSLNNILSMIALLLFV